MKLEQLSGVAAIALIAMTGAASADMTFGPIPVADCACDISVITSGSPFTPPTSLPFSLVNLGTGTGGLQSSNTINPSFVGINSIMFSQGSGSGTGLYSGNNPDIATSPFGGDSTTLNNVPNMNYLVAQPGGTVTINYTAPQTSLDLLWGTVDDQAVAAGSQNQILTLMAGSTEITGADIASVIPAADFTNGADDVGVVITGLSSFSQIQATDAAGNNPAFEFVPGVAPAPPIGHGLAAVLAVCGGLFGFKLWERSKKRRALGIATPLAAA
jgi:hypothetical protein